MIQLLHAVIFIGGGSMDKDVSSHVCLSRYFSVVALVRHSESAQSSPLDTNQPKQSWPRAGTIPSRRSPSFDSVAACISAGAADLHNLERLSGVCLCTCTHGIPLRATTCTIPCTYRRNGRGRKTAMLYFLWFGFPGLGYVWYGGTDTCSLWGTNACE